MATNYQPQPNILDAFFWEGVAEERLLIQACADCGALAHPPVPMCAECSSTNRSTRQSSGRGRIVSWITSKNPSDPTAGPERIVVIVELEEGTRLISNLVDTDGPIDIGLPVEVTFRDVDGVRLPQFRPIEAGAR